MTAAHLDERDARTCRNALRWIQRQGQLYGQPADLAIVRALNALAMSASGRDSVAVEQDWISTQQAAQMLGLSDRQIRRRATELGGRKAGNTWVFPKGQVSDAL
jgi:hypothetical protein